MRELKTSEIESVSGGSLTTLIMGFFKDLTSSSSSNNADWVRPDDIPEATPVSGEVFGIGLVSVLAATVALSTLFA